MDTAPRILLSALLALAPAAALADEEPGMFSRTLRGVNAFFGGDAAAQADIYTQGRFSSEEARILRQVLRARADAEGDDEDGDGKGKKAKKPKKLPPGLKKKLARGGQLPPGWQKKFERGEVVSDEVWAQSHGIPDQAQTQISHIPGTEVIQVGDRVARVLSETREILDVIDLVTGP